MQCRIDFYAQNSLCGAPCEQANRTNFVIWSSPHAHELVMRAVWSLGNSILMNVIEQSIHSTQTKKCLSSFSPFVFLYILILSTSLWAQSTSFNDNNVKFSTLDVRNLEQALGTVNVIKQDAIGFMWLGTSQGLIKYDGHTFHPYSPSDNKSSIIGNIIYDITEDTQGRLWVASNKGFSLYQRESDDFLNFTDLKFNDGRVDVPIYSIADDLKGRLLVGSSMGLIIFDPKADSYQHINKQSPDGYALSANGIDNILVKDNIAIVSTHSGLNYLDLDSNKITQLQATAGLFVTASAFDSNGDLWFGTYDKGLYRVTDSQQITMFAYERGEASSIASDNIRDVFIDSLDNLWVATDHGGLNLFLGEDKGFARFKHSPTNVNSINSNQLRYVFQDNDNNLWVSTFLDGINMLNMNTTAIENFVHDPLQSNSLNHNTVLSIEKTNIGDIWVGTEGGLNRFDTIRRNFDSYTTNADDTSSLSANAVLSIDEDSQNNLWIGTWSGGLNYFDVARGKAFHYMPDKNDTNSLGSPFVWDIIHDHNNMLWVGTETGGVNLFDANTQRFQRFPLLKTQDDNLNWRFTWKMMLDNTNKIWAATLQGIFIIDPDTLDMKMFEQSDLLSSSRTTTVFQQQNGNIWVGTEDAGLNIIYADTGEIKQIGMEDGLPGNLVSSFVEDSEENVWAATSGGLVRIRPSDNYSLYTMRKSDGIASTSFNRDALLYDEGILYAGGVQGLSVINTRALSLDQQSAKVNLTEFYLNHVRVDTKLENSPLSIPIYLSEQIELAYDQNAFTFFFSSFNYNQNARPQFSYQLEGFDTKWLVSGTRNFANYTNIPSGNYVFKVKALDNYGNWSKDYRSLSITITPPWWRTVWAYLAYFILFFAGIYFLFRYQNLNIKTQMYRKMSMHDPMTNLYNRHGMSQIIDGHFLNTEMKKQLSILVIDIDHFKAVNDTYGHDAGDMVITRVAEIIKTTLRKGDHVARWGGEEFLVITTSTNPENTMLVSENVRKAVEKASFFLGDNEVSITVSIGAENCLPDDDFDSIFERADKSLYRAKNEGRNRTCTSFIP